MTDLDKLREKAQAATPGPWRVRLDAHSQDELSTVAIELAPLRWFTVGYAPDADADYIAAADPTTVLALIDRCQRAETALRERSGGPCHACGGHGWIESPLDDGPGRMSGRPKCLCCDGTGKDR